MSLLARLLNVFAIPGAVFEDVKASRRTASNWLVPALISSTVGIFGAIVMYSQPAFLAQIHDQFTHQKQTIEQSVKDKQMTQEDADWLYKMMDFLAQPVTLKSMGAFGAVVRTVI